MNKEKKNFKTKLINSFQNFFWIFLTILGIQAFFFKTPYCCVVGIMLILIGLLFSKLLNYSLSLFNIKLTIIQKILIGITNFLTAAFSIDLYEKSYYRVIISTLIMLLFWIVAIVYSKYKQKKK